MTLAPGYKPTMTKGYVVRDVITGSDSKMTGHISFWYGPEHGWGNTWGRLDGHARVWPTKSEATKARDLLPKHRGRRRQVVHVNAARIAEIERARERLANVTGDDDRSSGIRWANEVYIGYLTNEPVFELATTYVRTKARRRGGDPLQHAIRADRMFDRAECGVTSKIYRHNRRRFDPTAPRACPRCRREIEKTWAKS